MKDLFNKLFINEYGKISWTALFSIAAMIILIHTYIDIWWMGKQYDAALLQFALEIILVGLGVRGAQRGLQYIGEGVAGINTKRAAEPSASTKTAPTQKQPQQLQVQSGNFQLNEFASKDGANMSATVKANILNLIDQLEVIRAACGNKPITITSGYRSRKHNASVGGAKDSQHINGRAADFKVKGMTPTKVFNVVEQLMDSGQITAGGIGLYKSWVHYDTRGQKVTWKG